MTEPRAPYTTGQEPPPLTVDTLIDMRNRLMLADKLVYAVHEAVSPGKALVMKESDMYYQYIVFHSQEEAQAVADRAGVPLLHTRDAPHRPLSFWMKAL